MMLIMLSVRARAKQRGLAPVYYILHLLAQFAEARAKDRVLPNAYYIHHLLEQFGREHVLMRFRVILSGRLTWVSW